MMALTDLSDEISPFPVTGTLLHNFQTSTETEFRSQSPLQKLRPVRSNQYVKEYPYFPAIVDPGMFPEKGSLIENLQYSDLVRESVSSEIDVNQFEYYPQAGVTTDGELPGKEGGGGNRWPQAETLALLRIRSEMDAQFRANPRESLWEIVSRKHEQKGYQRDSKKCKEKFENIYKYYKRTKERQLQVDYQKGGEVYKFFSELKVLDNHDKENPIGEIRLQDNNTIQTPYPVESSFKDVSLNTNSTDLFREFSSYDDDDDEKCYELDEEIGEPMNRKRKRRTYKELKFYFENLVKEMMKKQEEMYKQVIETMEKREKDRIKKEEARKRQEMERIKRDKEMRAQGTARSLALISFVEKFLDQNFYNLQSSESYQEEKHDHPEKYQKERHDHSNYKFDPRSNRWPKPEVQALITLRSAMYSKFEGATPKLPIWEEISLAMSSMGFSRSAKKCKEKWENINKYFKKTVANGKKRSENAKTCPYFNKLDILYKKQLLNPEKFPDETSDEGKERSANDEMLTTLAQVCDIFSMSEPLAPVVGQSGSFPGLL